MNILLFRDASDGIAARLQQMIEEACPNEKLEKFCNLDELAWKLRHPIDSLTTVVVLVLMTADQLTQVLSLAELLDDLRIILMLPDQSAESVARGHRLRPRFLCFRNSHLGDVTAVLGKMINPACDRRSSASCKSEREDSVRERGCRGR